MHLKKILTSNASYDWHTDLAHLFNHAEVPHFPQILADFLKKIINFTSITIITYKGQHTPLLIYDNYSVQERLYKINSYLEGAYLLDPFFIAIGKGSSQGVYQLTHLTTSHFQYSNYYQQYFKGLGLQDQWGISINLDDDVTLLISLGLQKSSVINPQDKQVLTNILPIIALINNRYWRSHKEQYTLQQNHSNPISKAFNFFGKDILTQREQEIVTLILQGHSTKSAARALNISDSTIKVHRKHIYTRLNISTQSQLFNRFLDHLLLDWSNSKRNLKTSSHHTQ